MSTHILRGIAPGFPTIRVLVTVGMRDEELPMLVCSPVAYRELCDAITKLQREALHPMTDPEQKP